MSRNRGETCLEPIGEQATGIVTSSRNKKKSDGRWRNHGANDFDYFN